VKKSLSRFPFVVSLLVMLAAFATETPLEEQKALEKLPVEALYNKALDASVEGNLVKAAKLFEDVERLYPYSKWATQAQMLYAYTLYED